MSNTAVTEATSLPLSGAAPRPGRQADERHEAPAASPAKRCPFSYRFRCRRLIAGRCTFAAERVVGSFVPSPRVDDKRRHPPKSRGSTSKPKPTQVDKEVHVDNRIRSLLYLRRMAQTCIRALWVVCSSAQL